MAGGVGELMEEALVEAFLGREGLARRHSNQVFGRAVVWTGVGTFFYAWRAGHVIDDFLGKGHLFRWLVVGMLDLREENSVDLAGIENGLAAQIASLHGLRVTRFGIPGGAFFFERSVFHDEVSLFSFPDLAVEFPGLPVGEEPRRGLAD